MGDGVTAGEGGAAAQLDAILNLSRYHREHEKFYALSPLERAIELQRAARTLTTLADRWAEAAPAAAIFARPEHPYTVGLLGAVPSIEGGAGRLASIEGTVPDLRSPPPGCRFAPRCPFAGEDCSAQPPLAEVGPRHAAACWRAPLDQVLAA